MGHDPLWKGYKLALGIEDSLQTIHVTSESMAMSSFLRHKDSKAKIIDSEVLIRRLDTLWCETIGQVEKPRVFLKMDTQGYDLRVTEGAGQHINEIIGLQSELSIDPIYDDMPHYLEALRFYEGLGFRLAGLFEIARNKAQDTITEMNCLMVRPDR
jgi:FkbM family methyltransferase